VADIPPDRLLAETDSPYLSPQPVRGRRNEPANVLHTLAVLARERGSDIDELAATIDENARVAFGLA
jgi:TatD DNase family protein